MNKGHNQRVLSELDRGDLVEFSRGPYSHWGVYYGNDMIVHLTSVHSEDMKGVSANLCCTGGSDFYIAEVRYDNFWDVVGNFRAKKNNKLDEKYTPFSGSEIINRANSKLGPLRYDLIFSNCEHFAKWCRYGISESDQAWRVEAGAGLAAHITAGAAIGGAVGAAASTAVGAAASTAVHVANRVATVYQFEKLQDIVSKSNGNTVFSFKDLPLLNITGGNGMATHKTVEMANKISETVRTVEAFERGYKQLELFSHLDGAVSGPVSTVFLSAAASSLKANAAMAGVAVVGGAALVCAAAAVGGAVCGGCYIAKKIKEAIEK
ncbi:hras-like suppressor 3 [Plakobranchus ocellatus]|uniref:Hras-like suppressor 3 n=1 Tax=Plakobranchus ocellatus TaxID=259542 RepID=A0AAV4BQ47_9GAST|nr:hras-like suppressor 3 [Plakobranchus ocellatus]